MEFTTLQLGGIVVGVMLFLFLQGMAIFYLETRLRKAPRMSMKCLPLDGRMINIITAEGSYQFPILDISRTGLSFEMGRIDGEIMLPNELQLMFNFINGNESKTYNAGMIYMKSSEDGKFFRVGLKFEKPLSDSIWKAIGEVRAATDACGVNQQAA